MWRPACPKWAAITAIVAGGFLGVVFLPFGTLILFNPPRKPDLAWILAIAIPLLLALLGIAFVVYGARVLRGKRGKFAVLKVVCGKTVVVPSQSVIPPPIERMLGHFGEGDGKAEQRSTAVSVTPDAHSLSFLDPPLGTPRKKLQHEISIVSGSLFRSVRGHGQVVFHPDEMRIYCRLGAGLLPMPPVLRITFAILFMCGIIFLKVANADPVVFGMWAIGIPAIMAVAERITRPSSIHIRRQNFQNIECDGQTFVITFSKTPVGGLKRMTFRVSLTEACDFLRDFDNALPNLLPAFAKPSSSADWTLPDIPRIAVRCRLAEWSLILGIFSVPWMHIITGIPAAICGLIALSRINRSSGTLSGRRFAIAGVVLGSVGVLMFVVMILLINLVG